MYVRSALILLLASFAAAAIPSAAAEDIARDEVDWACGFGSKTPGDCGIKAIQDPEYTTRSWIGPEDRVIGVAIGNEAKAYPTRMLDNHEIVTDTIGGHPVAITWCPLCGSAVVFERIAEVDGERRLLQFDVSGYLYKHDLVMWEAETETLWTQIAGRPIATWTDAGMSMSHPDAELTQVPSELTTWEAWKGQHPGSLMLSNEGRDYRGSYAGYEGSCRFGISSRESCDIDDLHPKEFVIGLELASGDVAYPVFGVRTSGGVVIDDRDDTSVLLIAERSGAARAYDATGYRFTKQGDGWFDQNGEAWDLQNGRSESRFHSLDRIDSVTLFWFAWKEHHPETALWVPEDDSDKMPLEDDARGIPAPGLLAVVGAVALIAWRRKVRCRVDRGRPPGA